jgi:hypothetical protein
MWLSAISIRPKLERQRLAERRATAGSGYWIRCCYDCLFHPTINPWANHAMTVSVAVVGGIVLVRRGLAWLLPREEASQELPAG